VRSLPPSRWTPKGMSTALSDAFAARKTTVTGSRALAADCPRSTRAPSRRSRAMARITVSPPGCLPAGRDVMSTAAAPSR